MVTAVLIDTISIQSYVFAGSKLKENLGASYLVENIYADDLEEALNKTFACRVAVNDWRDNPAEIILKNNPDAVYETGYIGGGNALLLFRQKNKALEFIINWTKLLLLKAPGLQTAVAVGEFDLNNVTEDLKKLFKQLVENKNKYFPCTIIPKHGITADCAVSGLSAEVFYHGNNDEEQRYISSVSKSKLDAAELSHSQTKKKYIDILGDKYSITSEIDKLGQRQGESHVAIVHVDGNGMGERFRNCPDLAKLRRLSLAVSDATQKAFNQLVSYVKDSMAYLEQQESGFYISKEEGKSILPLRPIIMAGDDVTFITDGRLGVHLAEKFIEFWSAESSGDDKPLTACAGIAIMKTKYPFSKGYKLAEELCNSAKLAARKIGNKSMLDFHIVSGGFSGSLSSIRNSQYIVKDGNLNYGPYLVTSGESDDEKSIFILKQALKDFNDQQKWPRSKVKELRAILPMGREVCKRHIAELKIRGLYLPDMGHNYSDLGWENDTTPYYQAIELIDFYPPYFLNRG